MATAIEICTEEGRRQKRARGSSLFPFGVLSISEAGYKAISQPIAIEKQVQTATSTSLGGQDDITAFSKGLG